MKHNTLIRMASLQLFAEGGAGAAGTGVSGSDAGSQAGDAVQQNAGAQAQQDGKDSAGADGGTPAKVSFDDLIKGDYKQDFDAKVQKIVQNRLKGVKAQADAYEKASPLIDAVAHRYGIQDTSDVNAILNAFDTDSRLLESEAMEKNMPVEQLAAMKRLERENEMFRRQEQQIQAERQTQEQVNRWMAEAEEAKQIYPELDLAAEIQNPEFAKLLQANVGVKAAYQVIHGEDIMQAAIAAAVKKGAEKVAASVAAGKARPADSGAGTSGAAVTPKTNVDAMSRADIKDVMRRVARGERISFG